MKQVYAVPKSLQHRATHYCPGCTHGIAHKLVAETIDELGVRDRAIGVAPVGCAVFAYDYFDCDFQRAATGGAAVATGIRRVRPDAVVFTYQGDGDRPLSARRNRPRRHEGRAQSRLHQQRHLRHDRRAMAPTTLVGQKTTTFRQAGAGARRQSDPHRRDAGYDTGAAYIARVALSSPANVARSRKPFEGLHAASERGFRWWNAYPLPDQLGDGNRGNGVAGEEHDSILPWASSVLRKEGLAMVEELIIAGFGGQGVMLMGQLLSYAGLHEAKNVSWMPSYGPEMRGGTANCSVVISTESIGSPIVTEPTTLIVMNRPSLDRFEQAVRPGGLLIYNSSLIDREPRRTDIRIIAVPAVEMARELGSDRVANKCVLGAYLPPRRGALESVAECLKEVLPERRHDLIPLNVEALARGASLVRP